MFKIRGRTVLELEAELVSFGLIVFNEFECEEKSKFHLRKEQMLVKAQKQPLQSPKPSLS